MKIKKLFSKNINKKFLTKIFEAFQKIFSGAAMNYSQLVSMLKPILDDLFIATLIVDKDGLIIYYNRRMGELDELSPQETLGYKIPEVYSVRAEDSPSLIALRSGRPVTNYMHYKTARGRRISALNNAYPLYYEGRLVGAMCLVLDVSSLTRELLGDVKSRRFSPEPKEEKPRPRNRFKDIMGKNPVFREAVDVAKVAAAGPSPVMLVGETGTGKDLFARAIHDYGPRADKPFMAINCSAIPEALLEGILFGTSRGAFTGAVEKEGLLEHASGGTVFLDEINSMPLTLQAKLLRVLQDHKVRRVGGLTEKKVDLRFISASNVSPLKAVADKTLRSDLFYRLAVVQVFIPPLRERREDIPQLVNFFLDKLGRRLDKKINGVSSGVMASLLRRPWPGNVRELEHALESALNFVDDGQSLGLSHLKRALRHSERDMAERRPAAASLLPLTGFKGTLKESLEAVERQRLTEALDKHGGRLNQAAEELGLSPQLMSYKVNKYGLRKKFLRG